MLVSRGPAFWSGWVMSVLIHSAKKISEQRKWVRGCTNVKIGHERPKTLGWGVYARVPLDRPEYKRHNGPLDFLFGQALFMGLLKNQEGGQASDIIPSLACQQNWYLDLHHP